MVVWLGGIWRASQVEQFAPSWAYLTPSRPSVICDSKHRQKWSRGRACSLPNKNHRSACKRILLHAPPKSRDRRIVSTWMSTHRRFQFEFLDWIFFTKLFKFIQTANRTEKLPVMVFIHGGGWISGHGGISLYGPGYLLEHDVVLVSFNYRLGVLGFLSLEDKECSGNFGLKDQVMLLKWVRNEIDKFGGDPASVTIFGNSAGNLVEFCVEWWLNVNHFQAVLPLTIIWLAPCQKGCSIEQFHSRERWWTLGGRNFTFLS